MKSSLVRKKRSAAPGSARGQALTEFITLTAAMLIGTASLMMFAPDMMAAFTLYVRGFYVILGYPLG